MGEEIRRSGRATKGQHTKIGETTTTAEEPKAKRGRGARGKADKQASKEPTPVEDEAEDGEEDGEDGDAIIRCVCGYTVEDKDDDRAMVMCDNCSAWEHNECVGISDDPDELPEHYFCEQCRPQDHKGLLAAMARGEKPWEARAAEREREAEERRNKKKRGKKGGRRGRASEGKTDQDFEGTGQEDSGVQESDLPTSAPPSVEAGHKRKLPVESPSAATTNTHDHGPSAKVRKVSTTASSKVPPRRQSSTVAAPKRQDSKDTSLQTELVEEVSQLRSPIRQKAADAMYRLFVDSTKAAEKEGSFKLPPGQSYSSFGLRLGLAVEYALCMNYWGFGSEPKSEYGAQLRTILHNVKANVELRNRLLAGSLSPNDLANMSSFDMASQELKEKTAEMIKEAEKQYMLVQDDGPRIRRTHKGEELVEDNTREADLPSYSTAPMMGRRESEAEQIARGSSPGQVSQGSPVELPEEISKIRSPTTSKPLTVDTKIRHRQADNRKSATFDIKNVWSSVDSPDTDKQKTRQPTRQQSNHDGGVKVDPEIDSLLRDDASDEEYSPVDMPSSPSTIWRGVVQMPQVAEFRATAKHVAGADLSSVYAWNELIPSLVSIEGRIDVGKANDYLCGLQWSKTTDVTVVAIKPLENPGDQEAFSKLFDYFNTRSRYGVVSRTPITQVRDIYAMPLEAGSGAKPEFLELLDDCTLEEHRSQRLLLLTYTIKTKAEPSSIQGTPHGAGAAASPSNNHSNNTQYAGYSHAGGQGSPITPYNPTFGASPHQQQSGFAPPPPDPAQAQAQGYHPYNPGPPGNNNNGNNGNTTVLLNIDAARAVLGDAAAAAPSVQQLLRVSQNVGVTQFEAVRACFQERPDSRQSFDLLLAMLSEKAQKAQSQQ